MTQLNQRTEPIPQPPGKIIVGNMLDLGATSPIQDMIKLGRQYGPLFQLDMMGNPFVVAWGYDLVNELMDESRFDKKVTGALQQVRKFSGDGLFTAYTSEPNWSKAHNILLPNFSQRAMLGYHPMMLDIAEQLVSKWERLNPDESIDVVRDMTNLTLDTIGLCGFNYRFNSFYRETNHPFVDAMVGALSEAMERPTRLPLENRIRVDRQRKMQADVDYMLKSVDKIVKERQESGEAVGSKSDLLSYMLSGVDKKTGERLSDENIRYQIITFLIAGHETTSGLLSFAIYELLNNPDVLAKAYEEVDRVLGADTSVKPTYQQVNQLTYISQILKETLRLWPTAPMFTVYPYEDTIIGGKYQLRKKQNVGILISMLHRDKSVWGERAEIFDPENFTHEAERKRPANAYKPFGNGQRACIGRQFALQESALVIGMILQRFKLLDPSRYKLSLKETLTLKPYNLRIKVRPRHDSDRIISTVAAPTTIARPAIPEPPAEEQPIVTRAKHNTPLLVLFGSNLGTAEEVANTIAAGAENNGFATTVASLDDYAGKLPTTGAVIITTASYNGTPPDNAIEFYDWLRKGGLGPDSLKGVKYSVFGCGNRDWAATFQAIPRFIDDKLAEYGATRLYERGEGDAREDFDGMFQSWYGPLWKTVAQELKLDVKELEGNNQGDFYTIEVLPGQHASQFVSSLNALPMPVLTNLELQHKDGDNPSDRSTRHIELQLPSNVTYRTGDHLGVIPHNLEKQVKRVAARFGFDSDSVVKIQKHGSRKSFLPIDQTISVYRLLNNYVELQDVATRSQIKILADNTECPPDKAKLLRLCGDDEASAAIYREEVLSRRKSLIDLLEEFPACEVPFNVYLSMLPALRPRYYSISSSPMVQSRTCSLTVAVVEGAARSGQGSYEGVCTNYLRQQGSGSLVYAFVRDNGTNFRPPADHTKPMIMVGPGSGVAPFRGFLQERAAQKEEGMPIGPSLLFFGCRHPDQDFIYREELEHFAEQGITTLFTACSRMPGQPKTYVQDQVASNAEQVWQMIESGAIIYVCGDASNMAPAVEQAFLKVYQSQTGADDTAAANWLSDLKAQERYLVDVWPAS